jgi:hypothetical protein
LVVFIRHDSAEIWGFRYGLTLGIRTLKVMASTVVFARVVFAFKRSRNCDARFQLNDLSREFPQGRQRTEKVERQSKIVLWCGASKKSRKANSRNLKMIL